MWPLSNRTLDQRIKLEETSSRKLTPLHFAAGKWPTGVARLLRAGEDPFARDSAGLYPIHSAIGAGCLESVQLLLDTDSAIYVKNITKYREPGSDQALSIVEALIHSSADIQMAVLHSLVTRQHAFNDYSIYHDVLGPFG